ncbi:transposase [Streptomyces sp. NPDC014889]|uniref:transposase n=1 Tax=Streptomyces sp. NPDC014889 TaxID=3364928 RepID=UPI0036F88168
MNGIVWKFRTGTAWRDVPERYGPWATLHTRFAGEQRTGRSTGCCGPRRRRRTRRATSSGWCRSIPRSSELTSPAPPVHPRRRTRPTLYGGDGLEDRGRRPLLEIRPCPPER